MQQTMQAIVKDGKTLALQSIPCPKLATDEQILVRVMLAGLCRTDLYAASGKIPTANYLVLGHEFSGIVEKVGSNVEGIKTGAKVAVNPLLPCLHCRFCLQGRANLCQNSRFIGVDQQGCFTHFIAVPATAAHIVPDELSFISAAYAEPVAASLAVIKTGINPQEKGLIYGQNRFSQLMLRILKARGFENIDVYNPVDRELVLAENSYDYIIETMINNESLAEMIRAVQPGGKIILKSRQPESVMFKPNEIIKKEPVFHVVNYGSFEESLALLSEKIINVEDLVDRVYKLDEYEKVFALAHKSESLKPFFAPWES
ncbi:MAG: alcohol dehydrogenase catalytic domain-containing protein [Candidatus Obscuribacterales bacterium]|nr:alcohol dehydrogenase catalytic domain-containing protein [Candidatus Obscuribacterales bacterium]